MVSYEGISMTEAVAVQNELRNKLMLSEKELHPGFVGGADISLNLYSTTIYAGIILLSFPQLKPVAYSLVKAETRFPYVPGFLAFREVPALVKAWSQMLLKPGVLVVDGHGIAHPRRMGIATHFGTLTRQPSIGCAKNLLFGKYAEPGAMRGSFSAIMDKDETLGYALRTKNNVAPVFVSPGNLTGVDNSLQFMLKCMGKYRIPEPTRQAHELVNKFRRGELEEGYREIPASLELL